MANPKSSKPLWKKALLILAALAGFGAVAAALAPLFIPWDKVKDEATAYASKALGRQLKVEGIEAGIFTGVKIKGISLANAPGLAKEPFFANDEAKLSVSLLSLLTGKVVVKAIEFKSPKIVFVKGAGGRTSLSGLGGKPASGSAGKAGKGGDGGSLPVVVASFKVADGTLVYRDLGARRETSVKGLDLGLYGFSLQAGGASRLEAALTAEVEGKKIPFKMTANFGLDLGAKKVDLKSLDFSAPGVKLGASGLVTAFDSDPSLDLKLALDIVLETVVKDLLPPSALKDLPPGLGMSGGLGLEASAKGRVGAAKAMKLDGALAIQDIDVKYGDYPAVKSLKGKLSFDSAKASLDELTMDLGGSPVKFQAKANWGSVDNLLAKRVGVAYKLTSPKLVLDPFVALGGDDEEKPAAPEAAGAPGKGDGLADYSKSVPKGLNLRGEIDVDAVVLKKIETGKLKNTVTVASQVTTSDTRWELYSGTVQAKSKMDLSRPGPVYAFDADMRGVQLDKLVTDAAESFPKKQALQQLKQKVSGKLSFKADVKGKGLQKPARFQNMNATGRFELRDGVVRELDMQTQLAAAIPHEPTKQAIAKDLKFGQMVGEFTIAGRRFNLKNFAMGSGADWREGELFVQMLGYMTLDGGPLDFKVVPHFNPRVVQLDGELATAFADDKGWATYDFIKYAGPDTKQAKADFGEGVKKAARKVVDKKVEELKQKAGDEVKKQAEEKGKELLKNLFNR